MVMSQSNSAVLFYPSPSKNLYTYQILQESLNHRHRSNSEPRSMSQMATRSFNEELESWYGTTLYPASKTATTLSIASKLFVMPSQTASKIFSGQRFSASKFPSWTCYFCQQQFNDTLMKLNEVQNWEDKKL